MACIFVVTIAILSDRMKKRFIFVFACQLLCLLGFIINLTPAPSGVKYFGLFLVASGAYGGLPAVVTWLSNNLVSGAISARVVARPLSLKQST